MDVQCVSPPRENRRRRLGMAVALAVASAVPFLPTLGNGFAGWDDTVNFLANRDFRGLGAQNMRWACTTYLMGVYQPLGWLIYEAEYVAWGLEPRGYHLVSIVFHAANALALWALTCALLGRLRRLAGAPAARGWSADVASAAAVALFAAHPLRVEAVAWASCQSYLPGIFFGIMSVAAYLSAFADGPIRARPGWLVASWLLFALALLTKVAVIGLPFVLFILDVYPLRRLGPGRWANPTALKVYREKLAFLALAVPFMFAAVQARWPSEHRPAVALADLMPRLGQSAYGVWFYPIKTVFPYRLAASYPLPRRPRDYARWPFALSAAATVVVSVSAYRLRRRLPGLAVAWACYLVCLAPSLGIIRTSRNIAADRYSYVSSMPGVVVLAYALTRIGPNSRGRRVAPIVTAFILVALSSLSWRQSRTWRSTESLWVQCGSHSRPHHAAHLKAGIEKSQRGQIEGAKDHLLQALTDIPESVPALVHLGSIYWQEGRADEAEELWDRARSTQPDSIEATAGLEVIRAERKNELTRSRNP